MFRVNGKWSKHADNGNAADRNESGTLRAEIGLIGRRSVKQRFSIDLGRQLERDLGRLPVVSDLGGSLAIDFGFLLISVAFILSIAIGINTAASSEEIQYNICYCNCLQLQIFKVGRAYSRRARVQR